jgi:hypothetical protein
MLKHWIGRWARFSSVGETQTLNSEQGKPKIVLQPPKSANIRKIICDIEKQAQSRLAVLHTGGQSEERNL